MDKTEKRNPTEMDDSGKQTCQTSNMFVESSATTYDGFRKLFFQHWHVTITYCAMFWSFGMCVAFLGPTLLDLGCMTSSDMKTMSWVFFSQLLCSLIGATLAGYLAQRYT